MEKEQNPTNLFGGLNLEIYPESYVAFTERYGSKWELMPGAKRTYCLLDSEDKIHFVMTLFGTTKQVRVYRHVPKEVLMVLWEDGIDVMEASAVPEKYCIQASKQQLWDIEFLCRLLQFHTPEPIKYKHRKKKED